MPLPHAHAGATRGSFRKCSAPFFFEIFARSNVFHSFDKGTAPPRVRQRGLARRRGLPHRSLCQSKYHFDTLIFCLLHPAATHRRALDASESEEIKENKKLTLPLPDFSEHSCAFHTYARLCTQSRSFIGFLGIKIGLSGLEKAFKMRLKRSY